MTPTKIAIIFLRISGINWFIDVFVALTNLPGDLFGMFQQSGYLSTQRELSLVMLMVRVCIYLAMAIAFLFFNRPLAKLITKGLDADAA